MFSGHANSVPVSATEGNRKLWAVGFTILSGTVLVCCCCWILHLGLKHSKPLESPAQKYVAELVHANGMVLVRDPGKSEWREVKTGARLMEGDLVRTDNSGGAGVQYKNGTTVTVPETTVFTVRSATNNRIEVSASPEAEIALLLPENNRDPAAGAQTKGANESIELQQVVPFGRSLELIGRVEAGSRLAVNNEIVEVAGDGTFRYFTSPFPVSARFVHLDLKVTDLAGRTRIWTATHDFSPHGWEN